MWSETFRRLCRQSDVTRFLTFTCHNRKDTFWSDFLQLRTFFSPFRGQNKYVQCYLIVIKPFDGPSLSVEYTSFNT